MAGASSCRVRVFINRRGQQAGEFAVVIAAAALAALGVQLLAQRAVRQGVGSVCDLTLGPDTPERQADRDTDNATFTANATTSIQERGTAAFVRRTTVRNQATGDAVNEDDIRIPQ